MNPLIAQLQEQFKSGTMTIRLVMVNIGVFALIQLINALERLEVYSTANAAIYEYISHYWFALPVDTFGVLLKPWTLLASLFAHFGIWHLFLLK